MELTWAWAYIARSSSPSEWPLFKIMNDMNKQPKKEKHISGENIETYTTDHTKENCSPEHSWIHEYMVPTDEVYDVGQENQVTKSANRNQLRWLAVLNPKDFSSETVGKATEVLSMLERVCPNIRFFWSFMNKQFHIEASGRIGYGKGENFSEALIYGLE